MSHLRPGVDGLDDAVIVIKDHRALCHVDADGAEAAFVVDEAVVEVAEQQPGEVIERFAQGRVLTRRLAPIQGKLDRLFDVDRMLLCIVGKDVPDLAAVALAVILDGDGGDAAFA